MEDYWVFLNKAKYLSSCWRQTKQVVLLFKCWKYYGHSKTSLYFSYDSFTYFQRYMSSSILCNQYKGKLTEHPLYIFAPPKLFLNYIYLLHFFCMPTVYFYQHEQVFILCITHFSCLLIQYLNIFQSIDCLSGLNGEMCIYYSWK